MHILLYMQGNFKNYKEIKNLKSTLSFCLFIEINVPEVIHLLKF